jgi:hypothetical protein
MTGVTRIESVGLPHFEGIGEPDICYECVDVPVTFEDQSDDTTRPHPGKLPPGYYIAGDVPKRCPKCGHVFALYEREVIAARAERQAQRWHDDYDTET